MMFQSGKILEDCRFIEEVFSKLLMEYFPDEYDDLIGRYNMHSRDV
jgi:hypothetical protein